MRTITDYGKEVKKRLVDLDMTQMQLIDEVKSRTGMYVDNSVMAKLLRGSRKSPRLVAAINDVLGIGEVVKA